MQRLTTTLHLALLACLTLAPPAAKEAGAQVIRGVVMDSASQRPITGVLVLVADSSGREVQRSQVDTDGEFEFVAPAPGWYSVRAERLGMTTDVVERIDVARGDTISLKLELAQLPLDRLLEEVGKIVDLGDEEPPQSVVAEGGRVPQASDRETRWFAYREDGGVVVGQVQGVGGGRIESGGRVGLVGVGVAADVDSEGRFVISGLPEGTYPLTYLRPSLGGLDWDYSLDEAVVRLGDTTTVNLQPAHPHRVLAQACGLAEWKPYTGVVDGQVLLPGSGAAAPGVNVVAKWHESGSKNPRDGGGREMTAVAVTNALGAFRFCAIPTDLTTVEVTAGQRTTRVSVTTTLSDEEPVAKVTLQLPGAA